MNIFLLLLKKKQVDNLKYCYYRMEKRFDLLMNCEILVKIM